MEQVNKNKQVFVEKPGSFLEKKTRAWLKKKERIPKTGIFEIKSELGLEESAL